MPEFDHHQTSKAQLVGRDHEQQVLLSAFKSLRSGNGRLILVGGEAGIGKTTIVEQFVAEAEGAGATVLAGASYDVDSPPPYAPWREALSSLDGDDPKAVYGFNDAHVETLPDQTALFNDVRQRLGQLARVDSVVLILEDIHWSDRESLELLRFVGRSVRTVPLLMIATYRDDEITSEHPLYYSLPNLVREAKAERIDLRRFSSPTIGEMVETRYQLEAQDRDRLVEELERRTEGNPFFIVELLRSMEMANVLFVESGRWQLAQLSGVEVSPLVRQVIDRRFMQLDQSARVALQTAAILGHEVRPDHWLSLIDEDETGLSRIVQQAMDAFLLEQSPHGARLRFRHALVREVLYSGLPLPWRQMQHRRIGQLLADIPDADPATIAEHYHRAGDARAAVWALQAGRQARRLFAPHAIIRHLNQAIDSPGSLTQGEAIEAFRLRGWAHEISGEFDAADRDYHAMLRTALDAQDRYPEWEGLICLAELWAGRDYDWAGKYIEQALMITSEIGDEWLTAYSLNRLGNWHLNNEDPDRARDCHDRALEIFQTIGDQPGIAATEDLLAMTLLMGGDLIEARHHYARAIHLFQILDDQQGLSSSLANLSHCGPIYQAETMVPAKTTLDECKANAESAVTTAAEIDFRAAEIYALIRLGSCLGSSGEYQAALDAVDRSIVGAEEIDHRQWLCAARSLNGSLFLDLLDPETAHAYLEEALAIAREIGSRVWTRANAGLLARAQLASGKPDKAATVLGPTWKDDVPARTMAQRFVWHAGIELALERNDPPEAIQLIDRMLDSTPHASRERPAIRLSLLRGRALSALGQYHEAESWLIPARTVAHEQGARPLLWRIHHELGVVNTALGKRLIATDEFGEAHRLIEEIGATLADPDMRIRFLTAAHGQVPEGWAPTLLQSAKKAFSGLTRRQREVAALIAAGRSNREIADLLSISERTVETHVTAIHSTLDLSSRAQIAAWCVENGLTVHPRR